VPNLTTTRVLSLGTKFIPSKVDNKAGKRKMFDFFNDFKRRLNNKMFFLQTTSQRSSKHNIFGQSSVVWLKSFWEAPYSFNIADNFCLAIRDRIDKFMEKASSNLVAQNLSNI
jgi:hypothetical protein